LVSDSDLAATGLPERALATYRAAKAFSLPFDKRKKLAKKLGVAESTVKRHLSQVRQRLEHPNLKQPTTISETRLLEVTDPDKHARALSKLSEPFRGVEAVAKEVGIAEVTARRLAKELEGELKPLKREIEEIRLDDLTKRFGTLARDAVDAITPEKLVKANARDLAIISGVAVDKWQLLRGQPTQRTELNDRRQMNELLEMLFKEAKRRGIEIDVTPEGSTTSKRSPFLNAAHQREVKKIQTGDPVETRTPA